MGGLVDCRGGGGCLRLVVLVSEKPNWSVKSQGKVSELYFSVVLATLYDLCPRKIVPRLVDCCVMAYVLEKQFLG